MRHNRVVLWGSLLGMMACSNAAIEDLCPPFLQNELRVCAAGSTLTGIDVSFYQGNINWTSVAGSGRTFAIARVSDGTTHPDSQFANNWAGIKNAGMVRGVYQFFRPAGDPAAQADVLMDAVDAQGGWDPTDLPPVMDLEVTDGQSGATIVANALTWLRRVEARTGRRPFIYTGNNMSSSIGNNLAAYPLWIPNWGVTCPNLPAAWSDWVMWQDSATGVIPGISGDVDTDVFNGNRAALTAFVNASMTGGGLDAGPTDAGNVGPVGACIQASITAGTLNVRATPDTTMPPVGTLSMGDVVTVLETTTAGASVSGNTTWYRVDNGAGLTGWISAFYADCTAREALDGGTGPVDSGVMPPPDAGNTPVDAGTPRDAATTPVDAAVAPDATVTTDASVLTPDGGTVDAGAQMGDGIKEVKKHCGP